MSILVRVIVSLFICAGCFGQQVTVVYTANELLNAVTSGAVHIQLRSHLDLSTPQVAARQADTAVEPAHLDLKPSTLSLTGNCTNVPSFPGVTPPLVRSAVGQCVVFARDMFIKDTLQGQPLWLSNLLIRSHIVGSLKILEDLQIQIKIQQRDIYATHIDFEGNAADWSMGLIAFGRLYAHSCRWYNFGYRALSLAGRGSTMQQCEFIDNRGSTLAIPASVHSPEASGGVQTALSDDLSVAPSQEKTQYTADPSAISITGTLRLQEVTFSNNTIDITGLPPEPDGIVYVNNSTALVVGDTASTEPLDAIPPGDTFLSGNDPAFAQLQRDAAFGVGVTGDAQRDSVRALWIAAIAIGTVLTLTICAVPAVMWLLWRHKAKSRPPESTVSADSNNGSLPVQTSSSILGDGLLVRPSVVELLSSKLHNSSRVIKHHASREVLTDALDATAAARPLQPLEGRYLLSSEGPESRRSVIRYARNFSGGVGQFAIKFFLHGAHFKAHLEAYAEPHIRAVLPKLFKASWNDDDVRGLVVRDVNGVAYPPYMVLERGVPLAVWRATPRGVHAALSMFEALAGLLAGLHDGGYIHGNINPHNVLLLMSSQLSWRLINVATPRAHDLGNDTSERPSTATLSILMQRKQYASPEQTTALYREEDSVPSAENDIWALAVLVYESLAGKPAFHADTPSTTMAAVAEGERARYPWEEGQQGAQGAHVLQGLSCRDLLLSCLHRDASQRPSASQVVREIERLGNMTTTQ